MSSARLVALALAWSALALSTRTHASILPSFNPEAVAWFADEIVIASEGAVIDGDLTVASTLAGSLRPGDRIVIPELAQFAPRAERRVTCLFGPCVSEVTGDRMVLFLMRAPHGTYTPASQAGDDTLPPIAAPAYGPSGYPVSVAWIEGGIVHGLRQHMNPGPQLLDPMMSEHDLLASIAFARQVRAALRSAIAIPNVIARIPPLLALAMSDGRGWAISHVADEAFAALARLGTDSLPPLRALLADTTRSERHPTIVTTMAHAGGVWAVSDLVAIVNRERAFWSVRAPTLAEGWWNGTGIAWSEVEQLRARYMVMYAALQGLEPMGAASARGPVTALRTLWRSLPQLEDHQGLDQISESCDRILAAIH